MPKAHGEQVRLPEWLRDALAHSTPMDGPLIRRSVPRRCWSDFYVLRSAESPDTTGTFVRGINVSTGGVGCISRSGLGVGEVFDLSPMEEVREPVRVRVVHCTRTVQGYKVGLAFVPADTP